MNKIIFFIFSCLIFGLSGCEQKIDTWSGKDVAYVDMEADSTLVSFIYINTDVDTVQVRVQVMGNIPEDQPRFVSSLFCYSNQRYLIPFLFSFQVAYGKLSTV